MQKEDQMKQYPLIESMGCFLIEEGNFIRVQQMAGMNPPIAKRQAYVRADDLEKLLSEGVKVVISEDERESYYSAEIQGFSPKVNYSGGGFTKKGLLINVKPLENVSPVSKEELLKTLKDPMFRDNTSKWNELIERIESQGVE